MDVLRRRVSRGVYDVAEFVHRADTAAINRPGVAVGLTDVVYVAKRCVICFDSTVRIDNYFCSAACVDAYTQTVGTHHPLNWRQRVLAARRALWGSAC